MKYAHVFIRKGPSYGEPEVLAKYVVNSDVLPLVQAKVLAVVLNDCSQIPTIEEVVEPHQIPHVTAHQLIQMLENCKHWYHTTLVAIEKVGYSKPPGQA